MNFVPVGIVRNEIKERPAMTVFGVPSTIEIFEQFADGLLHFEKHSHIWVLAWLDQTGRDALQVTPRGIREQGSAGLHGVFSLRSPTRPNPIGLTAAKVLRRDGNHIEVDRLDFMDGTQVLDIKPYLVTRDMIYAAENAQIGRPASVDAIRESLLLQGAQFCGSVTPDVETAADVLARFRAEQLEFRDPEQWKIEVPQSRPGLADALMAMTRVRFAGGSIRLVEGNDLRIEADGQIIQAPVTQ
jgi:tRNA-Thr(GGU) m(6)t(6)A37 methyltransferase TsaA